jgi:hypothetical protein
MTKNTETVAIDQVYDIFTLTSKEYDQSTDTLFFEAYQSFSTGYDPEEVAPTRDHNDLSVKITLSPERCECVVTSRFYEFDTLYAPTIALAFARTYQTLYYNLERIDASPTDVFDTFETVVLFSQP